MKTKVFLNQLSRVFSVACFLSFMGAFATMNYQVSEDKESSYIERDKEDSSVRVVVLRNKDYRYIVKK